MTHDAEIVRFHFLYESHRLILPKFSARKTLSQPIAIGEGGIVTRTTYVGEKVPRKFKTSVVNPGECPSYIDELCRK